MSARAALAAALALAAWWAAASFGVFTLDDEAYVFANPHIARLDLETLRWALLSYHEGNWNPLPWLSHALDRALWGDAPYGHHAVNVALHALNAGLAVLVAHRLLGHWLDGPAAAGGALLAGVLFALHPVEAEAVVWIAQRRTLLAATFSLLCVLAWLDGRRAGYALALAAVAAALMSKPSAVALPLVLLALPGWRGWRALAPFVLLALIAAGITLLTNQLSGGLAGDAAVPLGQRLAVAVLALRHDAMALVWPGALAAFHPVPEGASLLDPPVALSLLAMVLAAILVVRERRQRPWLLAGAVWAVAGLLPTLGAVRTGLPILAAERYLYLPSLGIFLALAGETAPLLRRRWAEPALAAAAVLLLLPAQQPVLESWRDNARVWHRAAALHPQHPLPHALLGDALRAAGRPAEALPHCDRALGLRPDHYKGAVCKAQALLALRRWAEAATAFDAVLAAEPRSPHLLNDRGVALLALRRFEAAEHDFRGAIERGADDVRPHFNLGVALAGQQRRHEACEALSGAVRRGLDDPTPLLRDRTLAVLHAEPCWQRLLASVR